MLYSAPPTVYGMDHIQSPAETAAAAKSGRPRRFEVTAPATPNTTAKGAPANTLSSSIPPFRDRETGRAESLAVGTIEHRLHGVHRQAEPGRIQGIERIPGPYPVADIPRGAA